MSDLIDRQAMTFPDTVEEYMEQYKITDTEQVYTNGTEMIPIFRMKQWFEHLPSAQPDTDLSSYSDKLWKTAYERGKADALQDWNELLVICDNCGHAITVKWRKEN